MTTEAQLIEQLAELMLENRWRASWGPMGRYIPGDPTAAEAGIRAGYDAALAELTTDLDAAIHDRWGEWASAMDVKHGDSPVSGEREIVKERESPRNDDLTSITIGDLTVRKRAPAATSDGDPRFTVTPRDQPMINAMPGATWFRSWSDAVHGLHVYEAAGRNSDRFWHLMAAVKGPTSV